MFTAVEAAATDMDTVMGTPAQFFRTFKDTKMEEEEGDFPNHQPSDEDDVLVEEDFDEAAADAVDDHLDFVRTEAEKDLAEMRIRGNTGFTATGVKQPAKRPRSPGPVDDVVPNLAEIFDNYDTPHPLRISICRAYASYLASMQPKKPRSASRRKR